MVDNLVIYKTASPDLPGEFAGGLVEINTKSDADKDFQSLSVGGGYNTVTTGKNQLYSKGGKYDCLGVDDGTRSFQSSFPTVQQFQDLQTNSNQNNIIQISNLAKAYNFDWSLNSKSFLPNTNFQYT